MLGTSQPCVSPKDGTTTLCCASSLDVCVTSDALKHGECRRDANACQNEANCKLHFPALANCTAEASGLDSYVYVGSYQPLYYVANSDGEMNQPLRYNPSSSALTC